MHLPTNNNNNNSSSSPTTSSASSSGVDTAMSGRSLDQAEVVQWLNNHPEFVMEYLPQYATHAILSSQGGAMASPAGGPGLAGLDASSPSAAAAGAMAASTASSTNSRASSGANTPVRKISAQEFEKRGHTLKPMVSTVDGVTSFLGANDQQAGMSSSPPTASSRPRRRRSELKSLDTCELINELVLDICNDLDPTSLGHKILQNVGLLLGADRCSLFFVERRRNWRPSDGGDERILVSKLFDVNAHSTVNDCNSEEIRVPWGTGIAGYVAKTGCSVNIPDAYEDARFNPEIDQRTHYKTRSILCMPIKNSNGDVIGVAQAINKASIKDEPFNEHDEKVFASYLAFCGIGIHNAQMYERLQLENRRNQLLLDLAWVIFEEQTNLATLIHKIMLHTQSLLQCERCQVMLIDETGKTEFSQVFDLQASDVDAGENSSQDVNKAPRFPLNIGISGYVAKTGETLNIPDAYEDSRFDQSVDSDGFRTRSVLCMPIKSARGQIIGVAQLVNKQDGSSFNKNDENLFEAFAIFCGLGINNTRMYEQVLRAMAKQKISLEILSYHSSASAEEVQRLKKLSIAPAQEFDLINYKFSDFPLDDDSTLCATTRMFVDLDLINRFQIPYETLLKWMLSVKKNYRAVAYHNWRHAFNVSQTMFLMVSHSTRMKGLLSDVERLALFVGALCHDLDHRGTNNQFQIQTASPLAQLYSTSVMERHHFDHCIMILNTKGNEILANVPSEEYKAVLTLLEEAIIATDLALYFKHRTAFFNIVETSDWTDPHHRELLRSMMMTACDLAAITKPWKVQRKVAELIASEFFDQGDIEKNELKIKPMDMMDREKKSDLPRMQISFIDGICLPIYKAFTQISEDFRPLLAGCEENRQHWLTLANGGTLEDDCESNNEDGPDESEKQSNE